MVILNKPGSFYLMLIFIFLFIPAATIIAVGLLLPERPVIKTSTEDKYITVLGSRIRYQIYTSNGSVINTSKNNPPLILLHGFGNYKEQWNQVIPDLSYPTIIGVDMIGFGGSDTPQVPYTLETQRKYLIAFMDALNIDRAILAGISMGASVTAWTAAKSPDRIISAILIAPSAYPDSLAKKWPYNWLYRPGFVNQFTAMIISNFIYRAIFPNSMGAQAINVTSSYTPVFADALQKINQPALLVWSKGDKTALFSFSDEYRSRINNLIFIEVPEQYGHHILRRAPQQTAKIFNNFLSNI